MTIGENSGRGTGRRTEIKRKYKVANVAPASEKSSQHRRRCLRPGQPVNADDDSDDEPPRRPASQLHIHRPAHTRAPLAAARRSAFAAQRRSCPAPRRRPPVLMAISINWHEEEDDDAFQLARRCVFCTSFLTSFVCRCILNSFTGVSCSLLNLVLVY